MDVTTLTDENFDQNVWLSPSITQGGTVSVVLFTNGVKASGDEKKKASERMSDVLTELAADYKEKVGLKFFEVNFAANKEIATRYDVQSAPTLLLLQIEEVIGGYIKEDIKKKIDKKLE